MIVYHMILDNNKMEYFRAYNNTILQKDNFLAKFASHLKDQKSLDYQKN